MARNSDPLSDSFGTDSEGWFANLVTDEDELDRPAMWRLGLWGFAAVGALTLAILSGQLPLTAQRTQLAKDELAGRAKEVAAGIEENRLEARRLSAAIDTLNGDRDRVFARLSAFEQNLDTVTGSLRKADEKPATTPWPDVKERTVDPVPFAVTAPPSSQPGSAAASSELPAAAPTAATSTEPAPVESAALAPSPVPPVPSVIQAAPLPEPQPELTEKAAEEVRVASADFGVDLGAANSMNGLRALWRSVAKSHKKQFDGLRPLVAVQERHSGSGLQLRLIAGPIRDAAAAAHICAVLDESKRECKTTAFDGQRLSLSAEAEEHSLLPIRPSKPRKPRRTKPAQAETPDKLPERTSSFGAMLGIR